MTRKKHIIKLSLTQLLLSLLLLISLIGSYYYIRENRTDKLHFLNTKEKAWLAQHQEIRLVIDPDFSPYEFFDENKEAKGIGVDYVWILEEMLGIKVKVIYTETWPKTMEMVINKQADFISCLESTEYRSHLFSYSKPYYFSNFVFITHRDFKSDLNADSLKGERIATVNAWSNSARLRKFYPDLIDAPYPSMNEALQAVSEKKEKAAFFTLSNIGYVLEKNKIKNLKVAEYTNIQSELRFGVRKDWPIFAQIIDKALAQIPEEKHIEIKRKWILSDSKTITKNIFAHRNLLIIIIILLLFTGSLLLFRYRKRIFFKMNPANKHWRIIIYFLILSPIIYLLSKESLRTKHESLTPSERKWLKENSGKIKLGAEKDFAPFYFFDDNDIYSGIFADYLKRIEEELNFKFEVVQFTHWHAVLNAAEKGEIDFIFGAQNTTPRREFLDFSKAHTKIKDVIITRKDSSNNLRLEDMKGMKIHVESGGMLHEYLKSEYPYLEVVPVHGYFEALTNVSLNNGDAVVGPLPNCSYRIEKESITNLKISGTTDYQIELAFATTKENPILLDILKKGFSLVSEKEKEEIFNKWVRLDKAAFYTNSKFWKWGLIIIAIWVIVIILIISWNQSLKASVNKKKSELTENRRRFSTLLANLPGMAYRCKNDEFWTMLFVSQGCYQLTGYSPKEILNNQDVSFNDIILPQFNDYVKYEIDKSIQKKKSYHLIYQINTKTNQIKWIWEKGQGIFDNNGKLIALEGFITDISRRINTEEKVKTLNNELENLVEERTKQLKATNKDLQDFAYIVSHDLKAPLRGINQLSQWFAMDYKDNIGSEGEKQLNMVQNRVRKMEALIDGVLKYSRAGSKTPSYKDLDLNNLIKETVTSTPIKDQVQIRIQEDLPIICSDADKLSIIFQNLIENAIQHANQKKTEITVHFKEDNKYWEFCIEDNGIGIEAKYQERIFRIFQTLNSKSSSENLGIGLAITKKLINSMGGKIWIKSEPNKGSKFFFCLPIIDCNQINDNQTI